jgi:hypothetical protein
VWDSRAVAPDCPRCVSPPLCLLLPLLLRPTTYYYYLTLPWRSVAILAQSRHPLEYSIAAMTSRFDAVALGGLALEGLTPARLGSPRVPSAQPKVKAPPVVGTKSNAAAPPRGHAYQHPEPLSARLRSAAASRFSPPAAASQALSAETPLFVAASQPRAPEPDSAASPPPAASPPARSSPAVRRAAAKVAAERAASGAAAPRAPEEAPGEFPPPASSTGRRYYGLLRRHTGSLPAVAPGQECAIRKLGGSWCAKGVAPRGFGTLEGALNYLAAEYPDHESFCVLRV